LNSNSLVGSSASGTLVDSVWHHIAYVYDGHEERIYIDGQKRASRTLPAAIWIGGYLLGQTAVGGISDNGLRAGFQGYIDTLRISNVARYSGDSFTAPSSKLSTDGNTLLLYNFDAQPGSTTITDLSGHGLRGTLGVGFTGATSPQFVSNPVPEPSTFALLGAGVVTLIGFVWRRRSA
jgi:hypothetical protein